MDLIMRKPDFVESQPQVYINKIFQRKIVNIFNPIILAYVMGAH